MISYLKKTTCESYYVRGRQSNVDCFYLAQNYIKLLRQTIRERQFYLSFSQDLMNLNHIIDDHMRSDMTTEELKQLFKTAWEKQHGFVIIDRSS